MPKRVDHLSQRRAIAEAAIQVIDASGLEAARLRDVALAAQVTTGAVTHYFDGKDALLEAALEEIVRRILERQEGHAGGGDLLERASLFLPTDDESRREWRVWFAFWDRAMTDPRLRALHRRYYDEIISRVAAEIEADGVPRAKAQLQADALVAAIDGVAIRATLEPEAWPPARQRKTLALLLSALA